jgi:arylsulfatase A-like enzyme
VTTRPNIVVFIPDQLRADALGCFGNAVASTPNIDALAASGTRFAEAYGQHPFCSQSRISFLTGWYPHVSGHRTLTNLLKPWEPNALRLLKDAGYHVAHVGVRGDTFASGVTKQSTSRFGWAVRPEAFGAPSPYDQEHHLARAFFHGLRPGRDVVDMDEACTRTAEAWLTEGLPEPWVLYVPLIYPHPPFEVQEPWFSMHDRARMPKRIVDAGAGKPRHVQLIRETYGTDRLSDAEWDELTATYYGMVSRMDDQLGRVLRAIDRTGATDRTAVLFFPDHGEYLGDHGLVEKWVAGMEPSLLHNPLIVRVPDQPEGQVAHGFAELIDVAPTMLELAEVEAGYTHFGRSLLPVVADAATPHRHAAFSEGGFLPDEIARSEAAGFPYDLKHGLERSDPEAAGRCAAVRTTEWTYVHRVADTDELYDRRADPHELHNLVDDPTHTSTRGALRDLLLDWWTATSDVVPPHADGRFDTDGMLTPAR